MGARTKPRIPSYRHHKPSGQAVVTIGGKDSYLGRWQSAESKAEYQRLIAEWLSAGASPACPPIDPKKPIAVAELILRFWEHAKVHYRKNGEPTSELGLIQLALNPVRQLYGHTLARDFGPLALKACRQQMIERKLSRKVINHHVGRIRRMFRWATENELVPASILEGLRAVTGLQHGRCDALETEPVEPVSEEHARAVFAHVSAEVRAMIELQLLTGMRPGEVIAMRACDLNASGATWSYVPVTHKTEHHGRGRIILLGPRAQDVIRPFFKPELSGHLFSPAAAIERLRAERRASRQTPMTPSHARRRRKVSSRRSPGDRYTTNSYAHAVARACKLANVPHWHPNQLRHTAATRFRQAYGIEVTRTILGHSSAVTSEIYAEQDREKAQRAMQDVG